MDSPPSTTQPQAPHTFLSLQCSLLSIIFQKYGKGAVAERFISRKEHESLDHEDHLSMLQLLRRLPFTTYANYQSLVEAAMEAGEAQQGTLEQFHSVNALMCDAERVIGYYTTSGTTGRAKHFPCTPLTHSRFMEAVEVKDKLLKAKFPGLCDGHNVCFALPGKATQLVDGAMMGSLTTMITHTLFGRFEGYKPDDVKVRCRSPSVSRALTADPVEANPGLLTNPYTGCDDNLFPPDLLFADIPANKKYLLIWVFAVRRARHVVALSDVFAGNFLVACGVLVMEWQTIEGILLSGKLPDSLELPPALLASLSPCLQPDLQAAAHLRAAMTRSSSGLYTSTLGPTAATGSRHTSPTGTTDAAPLVRSSRGSDAAGTVPTVLPQASSAAAAATSSEAAVPSASSPGRVPIGTAGAVEDRGHHSTVDMSTPLLPKLFPHLCLVSCVVTAQASRYIPLLRRYTGRVPIISPQYAASEGWYGHNSAFDSPSQVWDPSDQQLAIQSYTLLPDTHCFYEFIPEGELERECPSAVTCEGVKCEEVYELVITNTEGLFRYRTGDLVRIAAFHDSSPCVVVEGRLGQAVNLICEKMTEAQIVVAHHQAATQCPTLPEYQLSEFAVSECATLGSFLQHYVVFWELQSAPIPSHQMQVMNQMMHLLGVAGQVARHKTPMSENTQVDQMAPAHRDITTGSYIVSTPSDKRLNADSIAAWDTQEKHMPLKVTQPQGEHNVDICKDMSLTQKDNHVGDQTAEHGTPILRSRQNHGSKDTENYAPVRGQELAAIRDTCADTAIEHLVASWAAVLDDKLQQGNFFYHQFRCSGQIGMLDLRLVLPGTFASIRKSFLDTCSTAPSQYKCPSVVNSPMMESRLKERTWWSSLHPASSVGALM